MNAAPGSAMKCTLLLSTQFWTILYNFKLLVGKRKMMECKYGSCNFVLFQLSFDCGAGKHGQIVLIDTPASRASRQRNFWQRVALAVPLSTATNI